MKLNVLFIISAIYLALVGLGYLLAPTVILFGTVGPDTSPALLANLRVAASTFFGIAVLNWMARNADPSQARNAIVLGNTIGFAVAGVLSVVALLSGAPMIELVPTIINLLIAVAFFWLGRTTMSLKMA